MRLDYRTLALLGARRMLSRLDRRPWSPTYGCFDREFWHYKTFIEFPRPNFQQAMWGLALLYKTPFEGNEFAGHPAVLEWLSAALKFWVAMRHRDGSVDEWFLHERSFCATAFSTAAAAETLLLVRAELNPATQSQVLQAIRQTAAWLRTRPNLQVANQVIVALVASDALRHLAPSNEAAFSDWKRLALDLQHAEGWFSEYGGADIGYGLLALDLLVHVWARRPDADIERSVRSLLAFLACFVHPDGSIGGDYGSRGTNHCFLYGLEALAARGWPAACAMVKVLRQQERLPNVLTTDDTYACYFYFNSACLTATVELLDVSSASRPARVCRAFPGAGLLVHETDAYKAVVSTRRGVWRAFDRHGQVFGDAGYVVQTPDGDIWTSSRSENIAPAILAGNVEVTKAFTRLDTALPLVLHVVAFKAFTRWVARWPAIARWFTAWVKRRKVSQGHASPLRIHRSWLLADTSIEWKDSLPAGLRTSRRVTEGAGMHSPSSMLYDGASLPLETCLTKEGPSRSGVIHFSPQVKSAPACSP